MKKIIACIIIQFLCLQGFSQFPFYNLLPMGVSAESFGDTLLNNRTSCNAWASGP